MLKLVHHCNKGLVFLLVSLFIYNLSFSKESNSFVLVQDQIYKFEISIPSTWEVEKANNKDEFDRIWATPPEKDKTLECYALYSTEGDIDFKKLADNGPEMFKFLGEEIQSKTRAEYVEKMYYNKETQIYFKIRYVAKAEFGYILMSRNKSNNYEDIDKCYESFKSSAKKDYSAIIGLVILGIIMVGLGIIGYATRNKRWGIALAIGIPLLISGAIFLFGSIPWWWGLIIFAVGFFIMFAGREGMFFFLTNED